MSKEFETIQSSSKRFANRQRWLFVALLCVLTAGGTYAARLAADTNPQDPVHAGDLSRSTSGDALRFTGRLDRGAVHVGGDGIVNLELVATGAELPERTEIRRPTDVVVVLDRSGSMGGDPMTKALAAIRELVAQLGREDRFSLVTYSNGAEIAIPLARASEGARSAWNARLGSIGAGGGTDMSAGLDRAHELVTRTREAGRMARIVLLSDGHANQGDATPEGLSRRSGRAVSGEYVLSTVGVGEGFDERLMTRLADAGTGNFYYVPNVEILAGIFADEFESARQTIASALEIRIETPAGIEVLDAAGYPIEKRPGMAMIRPGSLFAGQQRSFWVTFRVPVARADEFALGNIRLAYTPTSGGARAEVELPRFPSIVAVVDESSFVASLDKDAVKKHHVEETVNRLRQSVAAMVSSGNYAGAKEQLDDVRFDELRALGYEVEETESFADVEELKREVDRAEAAPPSIQTKMRSQLGKSLYEAGTDGRRKGAKR